MLEPQAPKAKALTEKNRGAANLDLPNSAGIRFAGTGFDETARAEKNRGGTDLVENPTDLAAWSRQQKAHERWSEARTGE